MIGAHVELWGQRLGAAIWNPERAEASFQFEPKFLASGLDVAPLIMPISSPKSRFPFTFRALANTPFQGLPGLLSDCLPDRFGNTLINQWLSSLGRPTNSLNVVEKLLYMGNRSIGALEFSPANPKSGPKNEQIAIDQLVGIVNSIIQQKERQQSSLSEDARALAQIIMMGSSVGGARPKALIAWNEETNEVRQGQIAAPAGFGYWLMKFDGVSDDKLREGSGFGRVEMAYYHMAKAAGIDMMPCRLFEEGGRAHFMTQRFDRTPTGEKLHFSSLHGLMHLDFSLVPGEASHDYAQLFEAARGLKLSHEATEQLFIRMVFNVLAMNRDDHTKNFGFLMDKSGKWSLAPAFDVCHSYNPSSQWVARQSMSVLGKRAQIGLADFEQMGKLVSVKRVKQKVAAVAEVVAAWPTYAAQTGVEEGLVASIHQNLQNQLSL